MSLYVYALADSPRGEATGLCGEPIRWIGCAGLHAAVGEIENPPRADPQTARAHDAVVRALANNARALLPARFGSLAGDEAALRSVLKAQGSAIQKALEHVAGREQMTLRLIETRQDTAGYSSGTDYLNARFEKLRRCEVAIESIRPLVSPWVSSERIEKNLRGALAATVFHLIGRGDAERYREALSGAPTAPLRQYLSGPWPAYAFGPEVFK